MQKHNQLSLQNRYQIKALLDNDLSQKAIADTLGVHRSTISRELSRNVANKGCKANIYDPDLAQRKTSRRHRVKAKRHRFNQALKDQARQWLETEKLSPELISRRTLSRLTL